MTINDSNLLQQIAANATAIEVLALVAHDLGHRTYMVCAHARSLHERLQHLHQTHQLPDGILTDSEELSKASAALEHTVHSIRTLAQPQPHDWMTHYDRLTQFSIRAVVDSVAEMLAGPLLRDKIELRNGIPPDVNIYGVRPALELVFFNFALNSIEAIHSMQPRQLCTIEVSIQQSDEQSLCIEWQDNGPGISPQFAELDEVFQVGTTTSENKVGLGLATAQRITESLLRGEILVVSRSPAIFQLQLPIKIPNIDNGPKNTAHR